MLTKQKYYLITSANELTWKFDRPVVFLGDWCRLYDRKHIWQDMDAVVAKPYGLGEFKKDTDYSKVKKLEEKLFTDFYEILNQHHGTNHDERFWRIVVGHWFKLFVNLIFKSVNTLKHCLQLYEISGTTVYTSDHYNLATLDFGSAIVALNDVRWNNFLTARILTLLETGNLPIELLREKDVLSGFPGFKIKALNNHVSFKKKFLKWGHQGYKIIAKRFVRDEDAFIINSFLPLREEIKLELALGQWPQLWRRLTPEIDVKPNQLLRKSLTEQFVYKSENDLENILRSLLFELLPVYYLEGFADLKKIVNQQPWPKSPKFIFTSNNFHTDEIFKLWAAIKVEDGVKYYIGQHGNNYYTIKNYFPRVEEKTADKFFTWGWENGLSKYIPAFIFKTAGKKKKNYNKQGGLLLIETSIKNKFVTWDAFSEFDKYFEDQKEFVSKLDITPRKKLTIKLDLAFRYKLFSEDSKWLDFDPTLKIETGEVAINHLIADARLVVHSYDSTGLLETLSQNVPTLAFWQNDFDHLRDNVKPHYQMLVDVGIVHLSAKSVADKVNEIWDDVDGWWQQSHVQDAIKKFCEKFAKNCSSPSKKMASLLKNS